MFLLSFYLSFFLRYVTCSVFFFFFRCSFWKMWYKNIFLFFFAFVLTFLPFHFLSIYLKYFLLFTHLHVPCKYFYHLITFFSRDVYINVLRCHVSCFMFHVVLTFMLTITLTITFTFTFAFYVSRFYGHGHVYVFVTQHCVAFLFLYCSIFFLKKIFPTFWCAFFKKCLLFLCPLFEFVLFMFCCLVVCFQVSSLIIQPLNIVKKWRSQHRLFCQNWIIVFISHGQEDFSFTSTSCLF